MRSEKQIRVEIERLEALKAKADMESAVELTCSIDALKWALHESPSVSKTFGR